MPANVTDAMILETMMASELAASPALRGVTRAGFIIGLALSGFFDGILLHQVLQWHHLLSLVPGETFRDLRMQVYADGLFHVAVYAVALASLFLLWRARAQIGQPGAGSRLVGGTILGFGAWNIIDVGFFHWILGIHRIRVNVPNPMAYDLAWFVGLGVVVAFIGWRVLRSGGRSGPGATGATGGRVAAVTVAAALLAAVPIANIPSASGNALVVFRPDLGPARAINAILAADAGIVLIDPEGGFAIVRLAANRSTSQLYRAGALLVTRSPSLAGCLAFTDAPSG
jgi:uncharacterized membrane protein